MLLPLFLFGGSFFLYAQPSPWTVFNSSNSSLPQNTIRCLAVDAMNNKWVGTDYGLCKFNGVSWTIFNTSNSGLPDNSIRAISIDKNGIKWIGTLGGGVATFNDLSWTVYNSSNTLLPSNFVRAIAFDSTGGTWLGTSGGLVRFDGMNWTIWTNSNSQLISHHISSIEVGADQTKYLGTINGGMVYFKDTSMTFYNLWNSTMPDNTILSIDLDTNGGRWIGMPSGGLMHHDISNNWQWFATANSQIQSDAINVVLSREKVYLGSQDKGLIIKDAVSFTNYDSTNSDLPDVNVLSLVRDKDMILWIGTMSEGLVRLDESVLNGVGEWFSESRPLLTQTIFSSDDYLKTDQSVEGTVIIYDATGKQVKCFDNKQVIALRDFSVGEYFIQLISSKGYHGSERFVVR